MKTTKRNLFRFSLYLWLTLGMFVAFAATFVVYAWSEKQVDRANASRLQSFMLADELRQSSDDLTRMVRTYVITGNPIYKQHYQEVLDIRNGKLSRPVAYEDIYWDLVLLDDSRPRQRGAAVPLLELMRQAGFTEEEFSTLAEAKTNSDGLTRTEFAAMKLVETAHPSPIMRARAITMLYDSAYHQAKANIMQPISRFYRLADQRTLQAVNVAKAHSAQILVTFILFGALLLFLIWNVRRSLHTIFGGSVSEIYTHIMNLGRGDFSSPIVVDKGMENSVLGWLSEMQINLASIDAERKQAEQIIYEERNFSNSLIASLPDAFYLIGPTGQFVRWNDKLKQLLGLSDAEMAQTDVVAAIHEMDRPLVAQKIQEVFDRGAATTEARLMTNAHIRHYTFTSTRLDTAQGMFVLGVGVDITERVRSEQQVKLFRILIDSALDEILVVDPATMSIIDANESACTKLGYPREELLAMHLPDINENYPEHSKAVRDRLLEVGFATLETYRKKKNGVIYPVEVTIRSVTVDRLYSVSIARDITERKLAERELQILQGQLREQALHDPLTGLYNRRYLEEALDRQLILAQREGHHVSVIMGDLDHFKVVNDNFGHLAGDEALRVFGALLKRHARGSDICCRYGGEEFLLVLPGMSESGAIERAEQLRREMDAVPVVYGTALIPLTASFGVAVFPQDGLTSNELTAVADRALYAAKAAGRNRVTYIPTTVPGNESTIS